MFPTLTEPLRSRAELERLVDDTAAWSALFERPLSETLEDTVDSDLARGTVLTDAAIGTFAPADDPDLRQNRCLLYHVIGNGTGHWDVPLGGMGAVSDALELAARRTGAEIQTGAEVTGIETDGVDAAVACAGGERYAVLARARERRARRAVAAPRRGGPVARTRGLAAQAQPAGAPAAEVPRSAASSRRTRSRGQSTSTRATASSSGPTSRRPPARSRRCRRASSTATRSRTRASSRPSSGQPARRR